MRDDADTISNSSCKLGARSSGRPRSRHGVAYDREARLHQGDWASARSSSGDRAAVEFLGTISFSPDGPGRPLGSQLFLLRLQWMAVGDLGEKVRKLEVASRKPLP